MSWLAKDRVAEIADFAESRLSGEFTFPRIGRILAGRLSPTSLVIATALLAFFTSACTKTPDEKYTAYMASGLEYSKHKDYSNAVIQFRNAARTKSLEAEPFYQLALAGMALNQGPGALAALRNAARLDPDHAKANLLLATVMALGREPDSLAEAEGIAHWFLTKDSFNSDALFILATVRERQGASEEAEKLLAELLDSSPDQLRASLALARLKARNGDLDAAEQILRDALDAAEGKEHQQSTQIALASFYLQTDRLDDARREIDSVLAAHPENGPAWLALMALHNRRGDETAAEEAYKQASSLPRDDFSVLYGRFLESRDRNEEALAEYRRQLEARPANRAVRQRLVNCLLMNGQKEQARARLAEFILETPNDTNALLQRAQLYLQDRQLDEAELDLLAVLEHRAVWAPAHYLMAKLHAARGSIGRYRQELEETLDLSPGHIAARLELANVLRDSDTPRMALELVDSLPPEVAEHPVIVSSRIWTLIRVGDQTRAQQEVDAALEKQRGAETLLQDGILKGHAKSYDKALRSLSESLELNPLDTRTLNAIAGAVAATADTQTALSRVRAHVAEHPDSALMQLALGQWSERAGDGAAAREAYENSLELGDFDTVAAMSLARMDIQEEDYESAMRRLHGVLEKNENHAAAQTLMAQIEIAKKNYGAAIENYRQALEKEPENPAVLNNLAYLLAAEKGDLDGALRYAQLAREHGPDLAETNDTLGWVYYLRGAYGRALTHLQLATEAKPEDALMLYHLAMAHAKLGNASDSRQAYQRATEIDSEIPEAEQTRKVLAGDL